MEKKTNAFSERDAAREGVVCGRNAVLEALQRQPVEKLYVLSGRHDGILQRIIATAERKKVPIQFCDAFKLKKLSGTDHHQGAAATLSQIAYASLDDILAAARERGEPPFVVLADGIMDPHNLGAIIRTACCAGAHGVVIPKHGGTGVTPTVARASAGMALALPIARVTNLTAAVRELQRQGLFVYGLDAKARETIHDADLTGACAFIIGSEGDGVSRLVCETCDQLLRIPMRADTESLNASVAAGVVLFESVRQRNAAGH